MSSPIHSHPNPSLRRKAKRISSIDGSIQRLIDRMFEVMHQVQGVGLAAPQIGIPLRIAVIQIPEGEPVVLINPEIVKRSGERVVEEGCLSVPGYRGQIKRSEKVVVKALDRQGKPIRLRGEGLLAQALEHELDHLNGLLYIDKVEEGTLHKLEAETAPDSSQ